MIRGFYCSVLLVILLTLINGGGILPQTPHGSDDFSSSFDQLESKARLLSLSWDRDSITQSIELYVEASQRWKSLNNLDNEAVCLIQAGRQSVILGDKKQAEQFFLKALQSSKDSSNLTFQSQIYSELSLLALDRGEMPRSQSYFEKALFIGRKSADFSALANSYYSAGEFYYFRDQVNDALTNYKKSLELWQLAKDPAGEAKTLLSLGYLYLLQSNFYLSLESMNLALAKFRETRNVRGEAFTLKAIGSLYKRTNEYRKAVDALQEAERLFPADLDFNEKATLYNWFGSLYEEYADWKLSISYREKALNLFIKDNYAYGQMATLSSLGRLNNLDGDHAAALKYLEQADLFAKKLSDKFYLATIYEETGNVYLQNDDYEKAVSLYNKSLTFYNKTLYQRQAARIINKLGWVFEKQNKYAIARNYFTESLELNLEVKDRFAESQTLYNLARLNFIENNHDNALNLIKRSIEKTESLTSDVINSKLKSAYFSTVSNRYELYVNLLMKVDKENPNGNYAVEALQAAEKSRARSMLENLSLAEAEFTKDAPSETVKREKEIRTLLSSKADKLTDLLSGNPEKTETEKLDSEINELEHKLEDIKAVLKQNSPIYSAIKNPAPFDVAEFQLDVLDENSLLLEFSFGNEESYLWLVSKTEVNSYVLPPREHLESRIEKLRKLIDSRGMLAGETVENYQARIAAAETEFAREARIFSRELLGQVAGKLADKRLIIVPDGKLHYFPIAALPFPNSTDNTPILLTNETIYAPSAATLAMLMQNRKKISAATKNLLIFSDPIFSDQDARVAGAAAAENESQPETNLLKTEKFRFAESLISLVRLNASRDESDAIVEIVGDSQLTALSGAAATRERALDASISDYKIIHFATHGLIDEERPELSGIVLSQVDAAGQSRNGVVRLQDIYAMNLSADAVVLSACSTGIGKEVKGEGLLSLNNAFLQAGAKSVVASLWKVDDYATRELMKNFYLELASGTVTTAEALRRAQIKLRQNPQYQSPFYWAAFTAQGDFQNTPRLADGFDYRIYGLLILPFALILTYIYRRRLRLFNRKIIDKN